MRYAGCGSKKDFFHTLLILGVHIDRDGDINEYYTCQLFYVVFPPLVHLIQKKIKNPIDRHCFLLCLCVVAPESQIHILPNLYQPGIDILSATPPFWF